MEHGVEKVDGVLYDFGVSSRSWMTRKDSVTGTITAGYENGFAGELTAYDIVNKWSYDELVRIF